MKIQVLLPRIVEADVDYDDLGQIVVIKPIFYKDRKTQTIAHLIVESKKGNERRFILQVNAVDGNIRAIPIQVEEEPPFDTDSSTETRSENDEHGTEAIA